MPGRKLSLIIGAFLSCAAIPAGGAAQTGAAMLEHVVAEKAAIIGSMHRKAKKALVRAAHDRRISAYFLAANAEERAAIKRSIDQILLAVQRRFHVEEMCLIDPTGTEISRIRGDRIAFNLDKNESSQIFFAPAFNKRQRKVYVSPIYLSADAAKWVVSYATPIVVDGRKRAILHFEHGLTVYQDTLRRGTTNPNIFLLLVSHDGLVIGDSRISTPIRMKIGTDHREEYFERFRFGNMNAASLGRYIDTAPSNGAPRVVRVSHGDREYLAARKQVEGWMIFGFYALSGAAPK